MPRLSASVSRSVRCFDRRRHLHLSEKRPATALSWPRQTAYSQTSQISNGLEDLRSKHSRSWLLPGGRKLVGRGPCAMKNVREARGASVGARDAGALGAVPGRHSFRIPGPTRLGQSLERLSFPVRTDANELCAPVPRPSVPAFENASALAQLRVSGLPSHLSPRQYGLHYTAVESRCAAYKYAY
jgi:hypothetical protein